MNPTQRRNIVCKIWRSFGEWTRSFGQNSFNSSVKVVQPASSVNCLFERAEDECKNYSKSSMKSTDRIGQRPWVLSDGCGHKGMRELKQQRPARTKKNRRLSVDLPHQ